MTPDLAGMAREWLEDAVWDEEAAIPTADLPYFKRDLASLTALLQKAVEGERVRALDEVRDALHARGYRPTNDAMQTVESLRSRGGGEGATRGEKEGGV